MTQMVLQTYHDVLEHFGPLKLEMNVHRRFYRVGLAKLCRIAFQVRQLLGLPQQKAPRGRAPLQLRETAVPLELVSLDNLKMESSQNGASYILPIVDHYPKLLDTTSLKEIVARATTESF
ncbi:unnamed protein product [Caretta caretta]